MKKMLTIFIVIVIVSLFTVGCTRGSIDEISFSDYTKMMEEKDSFILFIGSKTCSHCAEYKITLEEVIEKYNVHFKYLDVSGLSETEYEQLTEQIQFSGTPTTVFIEEGKDNSCNLFSCDDTKRIDGALKYEKIIEVLKNMNYIKG